jgi:DNA-binding NtrC family response regulator
MANNNRVLVLDDEPIVGDRLKDALEKEGLEVEVFRDSSQAMDRLKEQPFGVLVTDMKMSGPSGMDVLRFVKEKNPSTSVIVITGCATIETNYEAQSLGADHFVPKPFKMKDLVQLVTKALRG